MNFSTCLHSTGGVVGIQRTETSMHAVFREVHENIILDVTPIAIFTGMDTLRCSFRCLSHPKCVAYNICILKKVCHLLNVDRTTLLGNMFFVNKPGWSYYDTGISDFNIRHPDWRRMSLVGY